MSDGNIQVFQKDSENSNGICRLCGRQDLKVINIFSEEGIQNDLSNKIEMHIPIKLTESRELPLECCLECVTTIISWHNFILTVLETNQRLSGLTNENSTAFPVDDNCEKRDIMSPISTSLQAFHQHSETGIPENLDNKSHIRNNGSDEDVGLHHFLAPSPDFSKESGEESDGQEHKTSIPTQPHHHCAEIFESDKRLKEEYPDVSDGEDFKTEISGRIKGIRTQIDTKLINEAKVVVGDRTYYNCKECGKSLLSPYTYVWHMRIHTGERPFMCDLCGKQFRVSQGLVRHLKETHKRIKKFSCDLCGRMFATKRNVDEHRRIHTNERPYVCALCSKSFKQKASLFVHNRTHSDNFPFKCEYCNQGFRTKPPLLIHITKHTGQKPYPCDICGRFFRIKYELKRHQLVHSEEKPFVCSSCGLKFKQNRYLRNHFKANHTTVT